MQISKKDNEIEINHLKSMPLSVLMFFLSLILHLWSFAVYNKWTFLVSFGLIASRRTVKVRGCFFFFPIQLFWWFWMTTLYCCFLRKLRIKTIPVIIFWIFWKSCLTCSSYFQFKISKFDMWNLKRYFLVTASSCTVCIVLNFYEGTPRLI